MWKWNWIFTQQNSYRSLAGPGDGMQIVTALQDKEHAPEGSESAGQLLLISSMIEARA